MDEKYILVSLEEEKSKQLANVLSNDTSRKILDYLAERNMSETELADALKMPISTVHYNVQNLLKNNLLEIKDFLYSEKGNKINIYGITKKMIVIIPKGVDVKNILLTFGFSVIAASVIYAFAKWNWVGAMAVEKSANEAALMAAAPQEMGSIANEAINISISMHAAWFLIGAASAVAIYAVISYIRNRK